SIIASATGDIINYTDITIDGIVFDNTYITLKSNGKGNSVFKNWTVTNCEFKNILTPDKNRPAFEYAQKAVLEKMTNFTFANNIIDNVSGGLNTGVRLGSAAGCITISDNIIKNVSWNAIQLVNVDETSVNDVDDDPVIVITGNDISGVGADEGMVNLNNVKCPVTFANNTLKKRIAEQPYLCYVKTKVDVSGNVWLDENGNALSDEVALDGVFVEENPELDKAIDRLNTLGIAKGMAEGYFGEKEPVTREQMAAFIYRFMNKGESLENGENTSAFTDVTTPEFYGMISWANEKGIIKGVSKSEFNPKGGITLQDCFTICLRALGYEENAELTYPEGYVNLAKKLRMADNVKAQDNKEELTRGDVAIILHNALYANMKSGENVATKIYERHALDGKKVLFIGNSWTFHGHVVFRKSRTVLELSTRRNDMGYFYQLAKTNGAEPAVTNWTWGGHALKDIFSHTCTAERECKGLDHLTHFTDYDFDYVFMQEGTVQNAEVVKELAAKFKEVNPDTKFFVFVPSAIYFGQAGNKVVNVNSEYIPALKEAGITVVNWGKMVVDIANGNVKVPGAKEEYNKNSFIVALSETDGHHPNMLTGYVTALMAYCAATGESAVGQEYAFCGDTTLSSEFDFDKYVKDYYVYDNATTNFPQIFASQEDMKGIQQLADQYLAQ
ncbi:MAG: S-layer homology domain-containing protein, partial [Clostridia bacterium]|nr:S-layer homology domain-containing protein [Clostridia bacterium]